MSSTIKISSAELMNEFSKINEFSQYDTNMPKKGSWPVSELRGDITSKYFVIVSIKLVLSYANFMRKLIQWSLFKVESYKWVKPI